MSGKPTYQAVTPNCSLGSALLGNLPTDFLPMSESSIEEIILPAWP